MKTILITGLDGSGKSTLLNRLLEQRGDKSYEIIFTPHIATDDLKKDPKLLKAALFINQLNADADQKKLPQLKGIALFGSMLLFKKLLLLKQKNQPATIFCERHPLIDTSVYARFYAGKINPDSIDKKILKKLDKRFSAELDYLLSLLPPQSISETTSDKAAAFLGFIYQWFFVEKKYGSDDLQQLFGVPLPDRIYFLQARPEVLYNRIKDRKVMEAHENPEVFRKLDMVYEMLFSELADDVILQKINANELPQLDQFLAEIYSQQSP